MFARFLIKWERISAPPGTILIMGAIYADYELVERLGESELTALFKGKHILIPDRFRTFKMPQEESRQFADIFKQEKLRSAFGKVCETAVLVANARDTAG